jgi:hypothetical protein
VNGLPEAAFKRGGDDYPHMGSNARLIDGNRARIVFLVAVVLTSQGS